MRVKRILLGMVAAGLLGTAAISVLGHVSVEPQDSDIKIAKEIIGDLERPEEFDAQIEQIQQVQDFFLQAAPEDKGIPLNQPREAEDVRRLGYGLCFDRSRAMEMILRSIGYQTRHASIYHLDGDKTGASPIDVLLTPGAGSHAITEVKTSRGWLLVDSNDDWISLTKDGRPIATTGIADIPADEWQDTENRLEFYDGNLAVLYGVYSRHGRFFEPYLPVPDFNFFETVKYLPDTEVFAE